MNKIFNKIIISSVLLSASFVFASAQTDNDQLLIFRNTGETNLLWQSQLDSITFTDTDTLGNVYQKPYAQIFHTQDTTLYVPMAEIDSVCFGSRNEIEFKNDVRILSSDQDEQWIIRCVGNNIYYKTNTPTDILPSVGQKLYYPEQTELFPYGLSVKVVKVTNLGNEVAVEVEHAEYEEIFSKFFYAGSINEITSEVANARNQAPIHPITTILNFTLATGDFGEITTSGSLDISGDVVINVFSHYYHADIDLTTTFETNIKVKVEESAEHNFRHDFVEIPLPIVAAVFQPSINIGLFVDFNAEMAIEYNMSRKNTTHISWTRRNGNQSFEQKPSQDAEDSSNEARVDLVLNGSIFAGVQTVVEFATVGDLIGARGKVKYGTELAGTLGIGVLTDLSREYNASPYGAAKLGLTSKLVFEGCAIHREGWIWGDVEETKLVDYTIETGKVELDFLPHFTGSRATRPQPEAKEISVATKTDNSIAHELETGFQIVKSESKEVVDSVFVETPIKALDPEMENAEKQVFKADFELPELSEVEEIEMRPVFHYAGFTIPFESVGVAQNPNIQPVISFCSNGAVTFVSGTPIIGTKTIDITTYHIGPFLPVPVYDKDFHATSPFVINETYPIEHDMVGKWKCEINDYLTVLLTLNPDGTATLQENDGTGQEAVYSVNTPQSGYVTLVFNDNTNLIFVIVSSDDNEMTVMFRNRYPTEESLVFHKEDE